MNSTTKYLWFLLVPVFAYINNDFNEIFSLSVCFCDNHSGESSDREGRPDSHPRGHSHPAPTQRVGGLLHPAAVSGGTSQTPVLKNPSLSLFSLHLFIRLNLYFLWRPQAHAGAAGGNISNPVDMEAFKRQQALAQAGRPTSTQDLFLSPFLYFPLSFLSFIFSLNLLLLNQYSASFPSAVCLKPMKRRAS